MPHPIRRIRARAAAEEVNGGAPEHLAAEHTAAECPPSETKAPAAGPHPILFAFAMAANAAGIFGLLLGTGALSPEDLTSLETVMQKLTMPRVKGAPLIVYLIADAMVCSGAVTWLMIRKRRAAEGTAGLTKS